MDSLGQISHIMCKLFAEENLINSFLVANKRHLWMNSVDTFHGLHVRFFLVLDTIQRTINVHELHIHFFLVLDTI